MSITEFKPGAKFAHRISMSRIRPLVRTSTTRVSVDHYYGSYLLAIQDTVFMIIDDGLATVLTLKYRRQANLILQSLETGIQLTDNGLVVSYDREV